MSNPDELSMTTDFEKDYEAYLEFQRNELRTEGAEELRVDILRKLDELERRAWTPEIKHGIRTAIVAVESAGR